MKKEANPTCTISYQATILNNQIFCQGWNNSYHLTLCTWMICYLDCQLKNAKNLLFNFKLSIPHSWEINKKAGKEWWKGYKERHQLSIKTPETTSIDSVSAFNHHNVKEYFDNLGIVLCKHQLTTDRI